jgi:hypothetical protein
LVAGAKGRGGRRPGAKKLRAPAYYLEPFADLSVPRPQLQPAGSNHGEQHGKTFVFVEAAFRAPLAVPVLTALSRMLPVSGPHSQSYS